MARLKCSCYEKNGKLSPCAHHELIIDDPWWLTNDPENVTLDETSTKEKVYMGWLEVLKRSALKGLRDVGIVAASAALTALLDAGSIEPLLEGFGGLAPVVALGIAFLARTGLDALKHRDKA